MSATFDPNNHLRQLRGKGGTADYLDVKWRLVWLRGDHPDAGIDSALLAGGLVEGYAIFRATVTIPGKGHATAHGSETKADFGDYLEKAETKAIGRALAMLGYGTQFVGYELDEGERIADAPVDRPAPSAPAAAAGAPAPAGQHPGVAPLIDAAWRMVEDGKEVATIGYHLSARRKFMTDEEWNTVKQAWKAIKPKIDERDAALAVLREQQPASYAG